jgi:hypothetical protein
MRQTVFPHLGDMAAALETSPVLLDGMKVVFDKKAGLVPVEMEKKPVSNGKPKSKSNAR